MSVSINYSFLLLICLVAAMGGLLFGYDWVVIGGAKPFYEPYFGITDSTMLKGWAMSSALVGCLVGSVVSGCLADRSGRKRLLIVSAILFTVSALGTALAWDFTSFNVFRLMGGIGIGLASNLSPMYIAEVAPARLRGRLVAMNQMAIVIGVLLAQVANLLIAREMNGAVSWRWMFAAEVVPAIAFLGMIFFVPESPRWLVMFGSIEQAGLVLARIGGDEYAANEVASIRRTFDGSNASLGIRELIEPRFLKLLGLGVFLVVFQQWCGINVIFNYAQEIFSAAGYDVDAILFNIAITGTVNLIFTIVAIFTVDRFGRRGLMLLGAGFLAAIDALLGYGYFTETKGVSMLVLVVSAIACYAMTLAPVTWVVISEIFPNRVRGGAVAVSVFFLWLACTVLTFTFPVLNDQLGTHGTFWLYSVICVVGFLVIWGFLPETRGRSLEEIEQDRL